MKKILKNILTFLKLINFSKKNLYFITSVSKLSKMGNP